MRIKTGFEKSKARIEMVPLFDVVLQLLVFFIYLVGSMNIYQGVDVRLPSGTGNEEPLKSFVINLTADNRFVIEGAEVKLEQAVEMARGSQTPSGRVCIYGDRNADLGPAIELLSRLRNSGIEGVSFLVEGATRSAGTLPENSTR